MAPCGCDWLLAPFHDLRIDLWMLSLFGPGAEAGTCDGGRSEIEGRPGFRNGYGDSWSK